MTKADLKKALEQSLQDFREEVSCVTDDPYSKEPVTKGDLYESHRQILYTLNRFKDILMDYLE